MGFETALKWKATGPIPSAVHIDVWTAAEGGPLRCRVWASLRVFIHVRGMQAENIALSSSNICGDYLLGLQ